MRMRFGSVLVPLFSLMLLECNRSEGDRSKNAEAIPARVTDAGLAPEPPDASRDAALDAPADASPAVSTEGTIRFLIERVDASHRAGQQSEGRYDLLVTLEVGAKKPERRHVHCPPRRRLMWENCDRYARCEITDGTSVTCDGKRFSLRLNDGKTQVVQGEEGVLTLDHAYEVREAKSRVRVAFVDL